MSLIGWALALCWIGGTMSEKLTRTNTSLYVRLPLDSPAISLSIGGKGLWTTDNRGEVFSRRDITALSKENWTNIEPGYEIASGLESVWATNAAGDVFFRTGFSSSNPFGKSWSPIRLPLRRKAKFITVNGATDVPLLLTTDGRVFNRNLQTYGNLQGTAWIEIRGLKCEDISQGINYAFCLTKEGDVYYRLIHFRGDLRLKKRNWKLLKKSDSFPRLKLITADRNGLWGLDEGGQLFRRHVHDKTEVSDWERRVPKVKLRQVSVFAPTGALAVITENGTIYLPKRHQQKCFGKWIRQKRPKISIIPTLKLRARSPISCERICRSHHSCSFFLFRRIWYGAGRKACWIYPQNMVSSDFTWGPGVLCKNVVECPE